MIPGLSQRHERETIPAHHHRGIQRHGQAVQADPIKLKMNPPGTERLKLKYDDPLSNFAFRFNLRRYNTAVSFNGADASVAVTLTGAVLTLSHGSDSAFAGHLSSFDEVDWTAKISAGIDVEVPALKTTLKAGPHSLTHFAHNVRSGQGPVK